MTKRVNREAQRVRQLANEYARKGYKVVYPRSEKDLPNFLRTEDYLPDLVATSENENLVIEVKTSETMRHDTKLSKVSELVNRQPGWHFLFVLTNPKRDAPDAQEPTNRRWRELLAKSRHPALKTPDLIEAAFLLAWAALEGAIRDAAAHDRPKRVAKHAVTKPPMSLIRDAAILGLIDRKDLTHLETLFQMRNKIVHSIDGYTLSNQDVQELQRIVGDVERTVRPPDER
jgi:hypothetical protein